MCFYDQLRFSCGDFKWSHFRVPCNRGGETCGIKLVYATRNVDSKCRLCEKIDTKIRRSIAERDRVARWSREGCRYAASIEHAKDNVKSLEEEIRTIEQYRRERASKYGAPGIGKDDDANDRTQGLPRQHAGWASPTADYRLESGAGQEAIHSHSSTLLDIDDEHESKSDTSSVLSPSDQNFSHCSGSSMTSHSVVEAQAAQDELYMMLSEALELCSLYKDAFHVMSIETFEKQFPRILKSYCTDLSKEASNDLERKTVRFMRSQSRQHIITRRICEAFGPEDTRAAQFARLEQQRYENKPLLERFLNGDHAFNKEALAKPDESDDETDSDAGYDCSNVELVRDFLLGKAFTNYQMNLLNFISAHRIKLNNVPGSSAETNHNAIVEGKDPTWGRSIVGQPCIEQTSSIKLETPNSQMDKKSVNVHWQCRCGKYFQEDIVEPWPGYADKLVKECTFDADEFDIEKQGTTLESAGTQSSSSICSTSATSAHKRSSIRSEDARVEVKLSDEKKYCQDDWKQGRWLLLCLPERGSYKVNHICVKATRCNKEMYAQLYKCYHSKFRPWIRWLTLRKLDSVSFIRFHIYWRTNVNIEASDLGSLPPPVSTDYDFNRTAERPPILRTALTHFLQHPSHAPKGTRHLARMPKKIGGMLAIAEEMEEEREGWGLYVREALCWKRTSIAFGLMGAAALTFAIAWCILHDGSIQDGFTVTGVLLSYGTILLGLIQLAVFHQSVESA